MQYRLLTLFILIFGASLSIAQEVVVNGYVYEEGNRGYLNQANVNIVNKSSGVSVADVQTNAEGYFEVNLPANTNYVAYAKKQLFKEQTTEFDTKNLSSGEKKFLKIQMTREPGYDFEVTLAPKRDDDNIPVDAIKGAWIEVYNNTTKEEVLNLKDHPELEFNVHFDKGNHYTVMIRKDGFFTKRMEAYVNVEGCILCFEGVGSVRPGVVDNLSEGNEMGVLLANVEMVPLFSGKTFEVKNIYYDLDKATLRPEAKTALNNLSTVLKDNPHIMVELGSHTDSRGKSKYNMDLSERRAKSAVDYLVDQCDISRKSIIAAGYGESDLVNDCADGVKCDEAEHQKNRRTEIKVLQINNAKKVQKTLAEIRVEEEFLKSVMNDEVETKIEKSEPSSPENKNINPPSLKSDINEEMENVKVLEKSEENDMIEDVVSQTEVKIQQDNSISIEESESLTQDAKIQDTNDSDRMTDNGQRKGYMEVLKTKNKLSAVFTGYKVVINETKTPLPISHKVFKEHPDVRTYMTSDNIMLYMVGGYDTREEVNQFMDSGLLVEYPDAYIVYFEKGQLKR